MLLARAEDPLKKKTNASDGASGLNRLNREHSRIQKGFAELDESIAKGRPLEETLATAEVLSALMLTHFIHETQFLEKVSPIMLALHRKSEEELVGKIAEVNHGLQERELNAAIQLRGLWKDWLRDHIYGMGQAVEFLLLDPVESVRRVPEVHISPQEALI